MAEKVKVWFDPEGDFLEVRFNDAPGFMRETAHKALMERVETCRTTTVFVGRARERARKAGANC